VQKIVKNQAKCLKCGEVVESKSRHDFRECKCGNVFVVGGRSYIHHGFRDESLYADWSIVHDLTPSKELKDVIHESLSEPGGSHPGGAGA
jgi:hypothetical protein